MDCGSCLPEGFENTFRHSLFQSPPTFPCPDQCGDMASVRPPVRFRIFSREASKRKSRREDGLSAPVPADFCNTVRTSIPAALLAVSLASCSEEVDENTALGIRHFTTGDLTVALEALQAADREGTADEVTYSYLARTHLGLGKYGEAHEAIEKGIALDPEQAQLHEIHGSVHAARYAARAWTEIQDRDAEDAVNAYTRAIELGPGRPSPHYNLGVMHSYRDSSRLAEAAFRAALKADPAMAQAHKKLGRILRHKGRAEEAAGAFEQAVRNAPDDSEAHYRLGLSYRDLGRFEEAAGVMEKAVELNPRAPKLRLTLGNLYMRLGRREDGRREMERSEELRREMQGLHAEITPPDGPVVSIGTLRDHYHLGYKYMLAGDLPNALLEFRRAMEIDPEHRDSITGLAMVLTQLGRLDEAAVQFEKSSDLDPGDPLGHARLGRLYLELGELAASLRSFEKSAELDSTIPETFNSLGMVAARMDDPGEAVAYFSKALELKPDYVEAQIGIGVTHFRLGRLEAAAAAYERALELDPDNPRVLVYLGDTCRKLGRLEESEKLYERARALRREQVEASGSG